MVGAGSRQKQKTSAEMNPHWLWVFSVGCGWLRCSRQERKNALVRLRTNVVWEIYEKQFGPGFGESFGLGSMP